MKNDIILEITDNREIHAKSWQGTSIESYSLENFSLELGYGSLNVDLGKFEVLGIPIKKFTLRHIESVLKKNFVFVTGWEDSEFPTVEFKLVVDRCSVKTNIESNQALKLIEKFFQNLEYEGISSENEDDLLEEGLDWLMG